MCTLFQGLRKSEQLSIPHSLFSVCSPQSYTCNSFMGSPTGSVGFYISFAQNLCEMEFLIQRKTTEIQLCKVFLRNYKLNSIKYINYELVHKGISCNNLWIMIILLQLIKTCLAMIHDLRYAKHVNKFRLPFRYTTFASCCTPCRRISNCQLPFQFCLRLHSLFQSLCKRRF